MRQKLKFSFYLFLCLYMFSQINAYNFTYNSKCGESAECKSGCCLNNLCKDINSCTMLTNIKQFEETNYCQIDSNCTSGCCFERKCQDKNVCFGNYYASIVTSVGVALIIALVTCKQVEKMLYTQELKIINQRKEKRRAERLKEKKEKERLMQQSLSKQQAEDNKLKYILMQQEKLKRIQIMQLEKEAKAQQELDNFLEGKGANSNIDPISLYSPSPIFESQKGPSPSAATNNGSPTYALIPQTQGFNAPSPQNLKDQQQLIKPQQMKIVASQQMLLPIKQNSGANRQGTPQATSHKQNEVKVKGQMSFVGSDIPKDLLSPNLSENKGNAPKFFGKQGLSPISNKDFNFFQNNNQQYDQSSSVVPNPGRLPGNNLDAPIKPSVLLKRKNPLDQYVSRGEGDLPNGVRKF